MKECIYLCGLTKNMMRSIMGTDICLLLCYTFTRLLIKVKSRSDSNLLYNTFSRIKKMSKLDFLTQ